MEIYSGNGIANNLSVWGCKCSFIDYTISPQVVRYSFNLKNILDLQKIKRLTDNMSAFYGVNVSISEKSNKGHFDLLFENRERKTVLLKHFGNRLANSSPYTVIFGIDAENKHIRATLQDMPHCLVAGTTGSGKSVALNSYIMSLCCYNSTDILGMVLIDLKRTEFCKFENLPHLLTNIAYDIETAKAVLSWLVYEMEQRYIIMQRNNISNSLGYFKTICVVIDELTDLVMQDKECKTLLIRLLQKARACDIHIICATQSPRASILDGVMLANLPTKIALTCASVRESMLILGHKGAEKLLGKGDAILKTPYSTKEYRIQIPYISDSDIQKLIRGK